MKTRDDQKRDWRKYKPKAQAKYYARKMAETGCKTLEEYKEHVRQKRIIVGKREGGKRHSRPGRAKLSDEERERVLDMIEYLLNNDIIGTLPTISE